MPIECDKADKRVWEEYAQWVRTLRNKKKLLSKQNI